jgi:hypothetical protein
VFRGVRTGSGGRPKRRSGRQGDPFGSFTGNFRNFRKRYANSRGGRDVHTGSGGRPTRRSGRQGDPFGSLPGNFRNFRKRYANSRGGRDLLSGRGKKPATPDLPPGFCWFRPSRAFG